MVHQQGGLLQGNMKMTAPPCSSCNISQQLAVVLQAQGWNMGISFQEMLNDFSVLLDLNRNWKTCVQEFYALNTWRHRTRIHTSVISSILKSINDMATFLNLWKQHHPLHILVQNRGVEDQIGWFHLSRCETAPGTAANHVLGMIMDELMYPESIRRCSITWLLVHPSRSWFPEQLMSLKPSWYNW